MPADVLCRSPSSKRKRDDQPSAKVPESKRQHKTRDDEYSDTRRILSKLFNAIETTLTASLTSSSSFHSIQRAVRNTARCDFEWTHLAQIVGVWQDAYTFESAMTLHDNKRIPSLIFSRPVPTVKSKDTLDRRKEFEMRLADWRGEVGELPALRSSTLLPLDTAKIESMRMPSSSPTKLPLSSSSSDLSDGKSRQSALLERVRLKKAAAAAAAAAHASNESPGDAMLKSLLPAAVRAIRSLLVSRGGGGGGSGSVRRVLGMRELADNLATSLVASRHHHLISTSEAEAVVRRIAADHPAWCEIAQVGEVVVVRFYGNGPA